MNKDIVLCTGDTVILYQNDLPLDIIHIINITNGDKIGWYKVTFVRSIGFTQASWNWILDESHLRQEVFTLNGVPFKLELYQRRIAPTIIDSSGSMEEKLDVLSNEEGEFI